MSHPASYPARCSECQRFMPFTRSIVVREYSGTQMNPDCDDVEQGVCEACETQNKQLQTATDRY
jgi:hypothetical protein